MGNFMTGRLNINKPFANLLTNLLWSWALTKIKCLIDWLHWQNIHTKAFCIIPNRRVTLILISPTANSFWMMCRHQVQFFFKQIFITQFFWNEKLPNMLNWFNAVNVRWNIKGITDGAKINRRVSLHTQVSWSIFTDFFFIARCILQMHNRFRFTNHKLNKIRIKSRKSCLLLPQKKKFFLLWEFMVCLAISPFF